MTIGSADAGLPSELRAMQLRERERAQWRAAGEQRQIARRMQALTGHLRLTARPARTLADRVIDGGLIDGRR